MNRILFFFLCFNSFIGYSQDTITVFFDHDSNTLSEAEKIKLNYFNNAHRTTFSVEKIEAHCDTTGSISYNDRLANRRINEVIRFCPPLKSIKGTVIGERNAAKSHAYVASNYRRVSIIYKYTGPIANPKQIPIESVPAERNIETEFVQFLKDTTAKEQIIQLSVLFVPGEDVLLPGQEAELSKLYDFLHYNQTITAHIRGHVCCGSNFDLSTARAYVVYSYLTKHSISGKRLSYKGYDNTIPFVTPEITEEDKRSNRRVDVVFKKN